MQKEKEVSADVILLDVVMPKMDGFDVLRVLRKENIAPKSIVLVLTNLGQKDDFDRGMKLGATDYIVKAHYTPSEVVKKVQSLLEKNKK